MTWPRLPAAFLLSLTLVAPARAQEEEAPTAVQSLRAEAAALEPLVESESVKGFLRATEALPLPETRKIYRTQDRTSAYSATETATLAPQFVARLTEREIDARFYYYTGYGSPLVYARPLDIAAGFWERERGESSENAFTNRRVLDLGYGSIGHLRLLASLGAECVGTEVEPVLRALYSHPMDKGRIAGFEGAPDGRITLFHGRWPADAAIRAVVAGEYDLIISKNVLKKGYIHPAREVDERLLVRLGVDDAAFLGAVHDSLKPGGLFLIYNISPAQNPEDQPYLPHADGRCPFEREMMEQAGLEVLEFDRVDIDAILGFWKALGYDEGKPPEALRADLFAWYTLARRPRP